MTLPLALKGGSPPALYIHSMPAWVLEDFCQKMDCLSDYDWMRFGEGPSAGRGAGGRRRGAVGRAGDTSLGEARSRPLAGPLAAGLRQHILRTGSSLPQPVYGRSETSD